MPLKNTEAYKNYMKSYMKKKRMLKNNNSTIESVNNSNVNPVGTSTPIDNSNVNPVDNIIAIPKIIILRNKINRLLY